MPTQEKLYTADDLLALPGDHKCYERVKGELVEVSPSGDTLPDYSVKGSEICAQLRPPEQD